MKISSLILFTIFCVNIFGILSINTVISNPELKFNDLKIFRVLESPSVKEELDLAADSYFLKIKFACKDKEFINEVFLNGVKLTPNLWPYSKKRGVMQATYFKLSKNLLNKGKNTFEIDFSNGHPKDIDIILSNFRRAFVNKNMYVLFSDSSIFSSIAASFKIRLIYSFVSLAFIGIIIILFKQSILRQKKYFLYWLLTLSPLFLILVILSLYNVVSKEYRVVVSYEYVFFFVFISFFFICTHICLGKILGNSIEPKELFFQVLEYVKSFSFFDKINMLFFALFLLSVLLSIASLEISAKIITNTAFILLLFGLLNRFLKDIKNR